MYQVKLNGGVFDVDPINIDWDRIKVIEIDVYLHGIWLNDLLADKTLEYFRKQAQEQLEYSCMLDPVSVKGE